MCGYGKQVPETTGLIQLYCQIKIPKIILIHASTFLVKLSEQSLRI